MRKIVNLTLAVTASCTFSFRKMSDVVIHKGNYVSNPQLAYIPFDRDCTLKELYDHCNDKNDFYVCYVYDEKSKYGFDLDIPNLINHENLDLNENNINYIKKSINFQFNVMKRTSLSEAYLKKIIDPLKFKLSRHYCFHITDPRINSIDEINKDMAYSTYYEKNYIGHFRVRNEEFKRNSEYTSASGVKITNTSEGPKICKASDSTTNNGIGFQKALKKYVAKHVNKSTSFGESFVQPIIELRDELQKQKDNISLNNVDNVEGQLIQELLYKSKIIFTQKEKELLDNSEILAVWHLIPTTYTNKAYIKREEEASPNKKRRVSESKTVTRTLIGFAFDKRDNTPFYWVTDLAEGDDIKVLLED